MLRLLSLACLSIAIGCGGPGHRMLEAQLESTSPGPIVSVQGYAAADGPELKRRWGALAEAMKSRPGFISARLSAGVDGSPIWLAHSEWQSAQDLRRAFGDREALAAEAEMPERSFGHIFSNGSEGFVNTTSDESEDTMHITVDAPGVVLINPFVVDPSMADAFVKGWQAAADHLRRQEGFISTALHRSLAPDARFGFVNVAVWSSAEAFRAAVGTPAFRAIAAEIPDGVQGAPALYRVDSE